MKLQDYKCPNWNNVNNLASYSYKNTHNGIDKYGGRVIYMVEKNPHNIIFRL